MSFGQVCRIVNIPLQRSENSLLLLQSPATVPLQYPQIFVSQACCDISPCGRARFGDGEVFQLFTKDDDGLLGQEWVLRVVGKRVDGWDALLSMVKTRCGGRSIKRVLGFRPEIDNVSKAIRVKLGIIIKSVTHSSRIIMNIPFSTDPTHINSKNTIIRTFPTGWLAENQALREKSQENALR